MGRREPAGYQENDDGYERGEEDWQTGGREDLGNLDVTGQLHAVLQRGNSVGEIQSRVSLPCFRPCHDCKDIISKLASFYSSSTKAIRNVKSKATGSQKQKMNMPISPLLCLSSPNTNPTW